MPPNERCGLVSCSPGCVVLSGHRLGGCTGARRRADLRPSGGRGRDAPTVHPALARGLSALRTTVNTFEVDTSGLASLCAPRDDLVLERAEGPRTFGLVEGPFDSYRRTITATPIDGDGDRFSVEEVYEWNLAVPIWAPLFRPLIARTMRRSEAPPPRAPGEAPPRPPWWSPPTRLDARSATVLSLLCGLALLAGYLATILTQTITFAADEFGASKTAQGTALAGVRAGVLVSLVLMAASDRRGRHRLLGLAAVGGALTAAAGALSPNLAVLGASQFLSRGFATSLSLLITVVAAEEMPAGGRAFAASVVSMTAALGAGGAVAMVAFADSAVWAWRIVYVVPALVLPLFVRIARRLPESRRFVRHHNSVRVTMVGHRGRLALLAASAFFGLLFLSPVSQFQNDYLRDERGFSSLGITLFTFATNTPGGIGIVIGGRLADLRGRRPVGAIGTIGGAICLAVAYQVGGPLLWAMWVLGTIVVAMTVPALTVYGPELFPTALRARANGYISLAGVFGSAIGLIAAGRMADHFGRFGPGLLLLAVGPLAVAALVVFRYPETANLELEELNPEDAAIAAASASPLP